VVEVEAAVVDLTGADVAEEVVDLTVVDVVDVVDLPLVPFCTSQSYAVCYILSYRLTHCRYNAHALALVKHPNSRHLRFRSGRMTL